MCAPAASVIICDCGDFLRNVKFAHVKSHTQELNATRAHACVHVDKVVMAVGDWVSDNRNRCAYRCIFLSCAVEAR